jgi:NAD/NADP transhydrogenase alpha subunit
VIAESDVVITTAQVFGRKPPVIVTRDMVEGMQPGSVVVDMAAETGGNVEGSVAERNGRDQRRHGRRPWQPAQLRVPRRLGHVRQQSVQSR